MSEKMDNQKLDDRNNYSQEFIDDLCKCGLTMVDINRVIQEKITIASLIEEIQYDSDNTRRRYLLEASYLHAYNLDITSLEELQKQIDKLKEQVSDCNRTNVSNKKNKQLEMLQEQLSFYEYIYRIVNKEIKHYFDNVDPYVNKKDFIFNNKLNQHSKEVFDKLIAQDGTHE